MKGVNSHVLISSPRCRYKAMEECQKKGKTKAIGISNFSRAEVERLLKSYGHGSGHVFNLGHGITPDVPPEHVAVLVDAVHELSECYHAKSNQG